MFLAQASRPLLLGLMSLILLVETIHNLTGGFEGIVIRWYGKHYMQINEMIRYSTPRRIWIRGIRATSRALDISGLILGCVFGVLLMQSTHVRWEFYLGAGMVALQLLYVIVRAGAFVLWLVRQIIKSRFWQFARKQYQQTGIKRWFMTVHVVQSVEQPEEMPDVFDPKQFFRFDVAKLIDEMWFAIDMWESWKYRLVVFGPRVVLFASRLVVYLVVVGKIVGLV